jgi:sugar lactone lactonase YvrE
MVERIQKMPKVARTAIFLGGTAVVVALIFGVTLAAMISVVQNTPRNVPVALIQDVTTAEYMILPDADSYPATVAVDAQGSVYTGSYITGTIWVMDTRLNLREIPNTREQIGAVSAITVAPNGDIYILDIVAFSTVQSQGAKIWKLGADDSLTLVKDYSGANADIITLPDDIAIDNDGRIYITDRGTNRNHDVIWRILPDGTEGVWWQSPKIEQFVSYAPTGLGYNAETNTLYVSDSILDVIYALPIQPDGNIGTEQTIYDRRQSNEQGAVGFDGISVAPDGKVYIAGLVNNRVGVYDPNTGILTYLAGNYRGLADVAYDPLTQRIFAVNWDQRSLLPTPVIFLDVQTQPHLPFSIDVITYLP